MKFKRLVESELLTELSQDGKWVTFKNGQHTYIGKNGDIETGTLKGYNVNNKKAIKGKYKQLQDQAAKKKKKEEKAKKREENSLSAEEKEGLKNMADYLKDSGMSKEDIEKAKKELGDEAGKDTKLGKAIANFGSKSKNATKEKKKQLMKDLLSNSDELGKRMNNVDWEKAKSRGVQDALKDEREILKRGGKQAADLRDVVKEYGQNWRKELKDNSLS